METRVRFDELISNLLTIIPKDQVDLITALNGFSEKWFNVAPELRRNDDYWHPIGYVLCLHANTLDEEWKRQICELYNNGGFLNKE